MHWNHSLRLLFLLIFFHRFLGSDEGEEEFNFSIATLDEQIAEATFDVEVAKAKVDAKLDKVKDATTQNMAQMSEAHRTYYNSNDGLDDMLDDFRSKSAKKYKLECRRRRLLASGASRNDISSFVKP